MTLPGTAFVYEAIHPATSITKQRIPQADELNAPASMSFPEPLGTSIATPTPRKDTTALGKVVFFADKEGWKYVL
jgi:hypothetical protein